MKNIKVLKMVTGEEIIAEVKEYTDKYGLNKPYILIMIPRGEQVSLMFNAWPLLSEDDNIIIEKKNIVYCVNPRKDLYEEYNTKYLGGISIPNRDLYLG